jgi:aryl-alcohol dehydrogenase-like predicted oxidoreductase
MRLPGPGVWGEPADPENARAIVRRALDLGVNLLDTAGYYGAHVADRLIAEALYPYPTELVIVTKVGAERDADGSWHTAARPEQIRAAIEDDLKHLRLNRLDLVHCRYTATSGVPLAESVGALAILRDEGKVRHIGVSNVSVLQLTETQRIVPIASVQNRYSLMDRAGEDVLDACTERGIAFMPFFPLAIGELARRQGSLSVIAGRHQATPAQIALAWLLARSSMMLPIPGTASIAHLEENVASAAIHLTEAEIAELAEGDFPSA